MVGLAGEGQNFDGNGMYVRFQPGADEVDSMVVRYCAMRGLRSLLLPASTYLALNIPGGGHGSGFRPDVALPVASALFDDRSRG